MNYKALYLTQRPSIVISLLTIAAFFLARSTLTKSISIQLFFGLVVIDVVVFLYMRSKKKWDFKNQIVRFKILFLLLFFVGITGWLLSPFAYVLYLLPFIIAGLYSKNTAYTYIGTLLLLFILSLGQIDLLYDIFVFISLLSLIPFVMFFQKRI